jgi:hypothetical protein
VRLHWRNGKLVSATKGPAATVEATAHTSPMRSTLKAEYDSEEKTVFIVRFSYCIITHSKQKVLKKAVSKILT